MSDETQNQNTGTGNDDHASVVNDESSNPDDNQPSNNKSYQFEIGDFQTSVKIPDHPDSTFDELYFLCLLSRSISLTHKEKLQLIKTIPKLKQEQVDELTNILLEEQEKFAELNTKHENKLDPMIQKQKDEWNKLENEFNMEEKKNDDDQKAEVIRKSLGL